MAYGTLSWFDIYLQCSSLLPVSIYSFVKSTNFTARALTIAPLTSAHNAQEDLENMGKEFRFWQTERRVFADKLADEERLAGDKKGNESQGADLDNQIKQVREQRKREGVCDGRT
jgi:hypothetical protein